TLWPTASSLTAAVRLLTGIADAGTARAPHSAAPATILIARAFMEHLLVLPFMDKSRPVPVGYRPATGGLRWELIVGQENNFGVLALTASMLRQSQSYQPCQNRDRNTDVSIVAWLYRMPGGTMRPNGDTLASLVALIPRKSDRWDGFVAIPPKR